MKCNNCGICCTAVSINSPEMTKVAGQRCKYLTADNLCGVWGITELQPSVCRTIKPTEDLCYPDLSAQAHYRKLMSMERATRPS